MKYKRVLLKLSGEALMGNQQYGIDPQRLDDYAEEIANAVREGAQIAIVIGGGNIFRGLQGASKGIDRVHPYYIRHTLNHLSFLQKYRSMESPHHFHHRHGASISPSTSCFSWFDVSAFDEITKFSLEGFTED